MLHRSINLLVSLVLYVTPPPPREVLRFCSLSLAFWSVVVIAVAQVCSLYWTHPLTLEMHIFSSRKFSCVISLIISSLWCSQVTFNFVVCFLFIFFYPFWEIFLTFSFHQGIFCSLPFFSPLAFLFLLRGYIYSFTSFSTFMLIVKHLPAPLLLALCQFPLDSCFSACFDFCL